MNTGDHSMGMDMGGDACKISMLWNWNTVGACFVSDTWQIKSTGAFAGSCIGVVLLVISLEFLRRLSREYDRYIRTIPRLPTGSRNALNDDSSTANLRHKTSASTKGESETTVYRILRGSKGRFRPTFWQQVVRAVLHMVTFGVAYFIMLLAMYYNGYIIICILIGAFIGSFIFSWEMVGSSNDATETTYCCG